MIQAIKSMINQKKAFMEHGNMILEDTMTSDIDDLIFLGEDTDNDEDVEDQLGVTSSSSKLEDEEDNDSSETSDEDSDKENDDQDDDSVEDDNFEDLPLNDDLPTPVGRQTGEPIEGDLDDLLQVTLDLKTNTLTDVLPVPPKDATGVVEDDILNTRIDSGFEDDDSNDSESSENDDILNSPLLDENIDDIESIGEGVLEDLGTFIKDPRGNPRVNLLSKEFHVNRKDDNGSQIIKLREEFKKKYGKDCNSTYFDLLNKLRTQPMGDQKAGKPIWTPEEMKMIVDAHNCVPSPKTDDFINMALKSNIVRISKMKSTTLTEAITIDGEAPAGEGQSEDIPPDESTADEGENSVTSAVKDKVAEAEEPIEDAPDGKDGKEELLKKLGNLTKSVEDAKTMVLKYIQ